MATCVSEWLSHCLYPLRDTAQFRAPIATLSEWTTTLHTVFISNRSSSRTGIATPPSMISSHSDLLSTQKEEKKSRKRCHVIRVVVISALSAPSVYYVAPTELLLVLARLRPWKIGNDKSHAVRLRWAGSIALLYWAFKIVNVVDEFSQVTVI